VTQGPILNGEECVLLNKIILKLRPIHQIHPPKISIHQIHPPKISFFAQSIQHHQILASASAPLSHQRLSLSHRLIIVSEDAGETAALGGVSHSLTIVLNMGWLRLAGSLKLWVSFAKEPCKRDYILQDRTLILRSLLIVATP